MAQCVQLTDDLEKKHLVCLKMIFNKVYTHSETANANTKPFIQVNDISELYIIYLDNLNDAFRLLFSCCIKVHAV